jgi:rod shape determining protein RodA
MKTKYNKGFDFYILLSVLALVIIGIFFIYSSCVASDGSVVSNEYIKQIIWVVLGVAVFVSVIVNDYKKLKDYSVYLYIFFIFLLIITLVAGNKVNGARSWLGIMDFGIQPSEFAKIATILMLSSFFANNKKDVRSLRTFTTGFIITLIPMMLILVQPDMGTALVYIPIFLITAFIAGSSVKHIMYLLLTGSLMIILVVVPVWKDFASENAGKIISAVTDNNLYKFIVLAFLSAALISLIGYYVAKKGYYYWIMYSSSIISIAMIGGFLARNVLKTYQIMRLIVFLDPYIDPRGAGWNIIQSITAVGSGGVWGKGFLNGTQSHYRYLPQQTTDFIFSIMAEELGLIGSLFIFLLFLVIIIRGIVIIGSAKDSFGSNVAAGVVAMIFFHFMVNIGMAMGIMPITGIPLLFLSYGGSSLWTAMIGTGLLINVYLRRYRY